MEAPQQDQTHNLSHPFSQNNATSAQDQDYFAFLDSDKEIPSNSSSPFFSENGLSQDIIKLTSAEPDICLEVFYALYNVLWPQIESQSDVSLKDAWKNFIGGSVLKGSLCPPEKLIIEKRVKDIKRIMSEEGGENQIFQDLDEVLNSFSNLKQKIDDHSGEILYKKEIIISLTLVQDFYQGYRSKVKGLIQVILEKEQMNILYTSESDALDDLLEHKAIMMSDIFSHHWAYRISRSQAQRLLSLDASGRNLKSNINDPSNHRVIALPEKAAKPLVFFKANGNPPIQPEKEFMLYSLYQHLQIPVPETAFLVLTDVFETNPGYFYGIQASEAVIGESPLKAYQHPEITFDHEAYVSQTIGAFFTNPSDGSFKNFKYSPEYKTFISIDNDEVFKPEIAGPDGKEIVNVKSILYLLPQIDLPIPESIKTFFATFDPHLTILAWLQDLIQKNKGYNLLLEKLAFQRTRCLYQNLLPQNDIPSLSKCLQETLQVDPELHGDSFYPKILVSQKLLNNIIEKFQIIEKVLFNNRPVSTQALFEEISPLLGKYYRKLRFLFSDIEEALEALWGNKKNGIDYSYVLSLLDNEEFRSLSGNKIEIDEGFTKPEIFFKGYKDILSSGQSALDEFIRRHSQRKNKNVLNLQVARKELQLLVQEGLTNSHSPRDIVDFCHILSKNIDNDPSLIKEITSLLSNISHAELKWLFILEKYFLRTDHSVQNNFIASSTSVLGTLMKQRTFILTQSESQYLFDQEGNIRKNTSLTGRSSVTCFPEENPEFYLKQYPEWPGYEFASTLFMRLLGIQHLPYQDFLLVNSKCPVLLTQKAVGNPVLHVWDNPEVFHNLDPVHTGLLIIAAMLINPEDGKEDNFILSPDGKYLIPIDNDHCFLPSFFQKEGNFWNAFTVNTTLQAKTLLFCLDEMYMSIPIEVRDHILSINFDSLLTLWMGNLDKIENKLNNLVDQHLQNNFLEHGTVMRIPFYKQFIHNIHWKAHKIQDILKITPNPTSFDLLKAVEPFAAKCYQDSFKQGSNLQSRFRAATNQLYQKTAIDGSRVSILNTRTMMEIINISEKDLQTDIMFQRMGPIDALELLNQLIQEHSEKATIEQEMLCELDEKKQKNKWFSIFGNSAIETNLKAFFADPREGLALKGSKLITSSRLKELFTQAPNTGMRIRFLSLPESPSLTDKEIRILTEECPNLEYLNVSGCQKVKQIFTVEGEWPLLARLEAKDCLSLRQFVSSSPVKILRVETDQEIEIFVGKSSLEIFTISKRKLEFEFSLKKGEKLEIKSQGQTLPNDDFLHHIIRGKEEVKKYFSDFKINLEINSILLERELRVFVTFIDFVKLNSQANDFGRIVLLNLKNLKRLNLSQNKIIGTEYIEAENDQGVEAISRGNWPFLEILHLSGFGMTAVGVKIIVNQSNWSQLKDLDLSNNKIYDEGIEALAKANWPLLEILNLHRTSMKITGVRALVFQAKWPQLKLLDISKNPILDEGFETLFLGDWPLIEILDLHGTNLCELESSLGIFGRFKISHREKLLHFIFNAGWPNLKKIYFDSLRTNSRENLLQKDRHLLEHLCLRYCKVSQYEIEIIASKCSWSQLKDLDLSNNPIFDGGLSIIVSSNWNLLEYLDLGRTSITGKGIGILVSKSNWPNLKRLDISYNQIGDKGLKTLSFGRWSLLEILSLRKINITEKGVQSMILTSDWPNLKILDLLHNLFTSPQEPSPQQPRSRYLSEKEPSIQELVKRKWGRIRLLIGKSKNPPLSDYPTYGSTNNYSFLPANHPPNRPSLLTLLTNNEPISDSPKNSPNDLTKKFFL